MTTLISSRKRGIAEVGLEAVEPASKKPKNDSLREKSLRVLMEGAEAARQEAKRFPAQDSVLVVLKESEALISSSLSHYNECGDSRALNVLCSMSIRKLDALKMSRPKNGIKEYLTDIVSKLKPLMETLPVQESSYSNAFYYFSSLAREKLLTQSNYGPKDHQLIREVIRIQLKLGQADFFKRFSDEFLMKELTSLTRLNLCDARLVSNQGLHLKEMRKVLKDTIAIYPFCDASIARCDQRREQEDLDPINFSVKDLCRTMTLGLEFVAQIEQDLPIEKYQKRFRLLNDLMKTMDGIVEWDSFDNLDEEDSLVFLSTLFTLHTERCKMAVQLKVSPNMLSSFLRMQCQAFKEFSRFIRDYDTVEYHDSVAFKTPLFRLSKSCEDQFRTLAAQGDDFHLEKKVFSDFITYVCEFYDDVFKRPVEDPDDAKRMSRHREFFVNLKQSIPGSFFSGAH